MSWLSSGGGLRALRYNYARGGIHFRYLFVVFGGGGGLITMGIYCGCHIWACDPFVAKTRNLPGDGSLAVMWQLSIRLSSAGGSVKRRRWTSSRSNKRGASQEKKI